MEFTALVFLSSGLFLGWSLGANDAANVFGTAVGSRMIRFSTAAVLCSVFLILGAVYSGAGAAHGLGKLGAVNALAGSFTVALSAAVTVFWMTRAELPVSTTQAIVGGIVGWNLFSGSLTDLGTLSTIMATWVACPIIGALFAAGMYRAAVALIGWAKIHMFHLDAYTRYGLILAGVFGAYSLGANNIGNVMGVFVASSPFDRLDLGGLLTLSSVQQLFLVGGLAIGVGVITYSRRVMETVGRSLVPLNPIAAWVVVVSHSLVLFMFSSKELEHFLVSHGLPAIPLIPVSSSQAVVGAVIGVALSRGLKGGRIVRWRVLRQIGTGWVLTPIMAALLCFFALFFVENVFDQQVYAPSRYQVTEEVMLRLESKGVPTDDLADLVDAEPRRSATSFRRAVRRVVRLPRAQETSVIEAAEIYLVRIDTDLIDHLDEAMLSPDQLDAVRFLAGNTYDHRWEFAEALARQSEAWRPLEATRVNEAHNDALAEELDYVGRQLQVADSGVGL
ncbi:MAG: inorganic phosphate transporter [Deltaproteobacteria bacterium]|nr:inorganic phosphate transporter [Deltaproteobacteria bacterium]